MKIRARRHSAAYWHITIDNPPINFFDQEMADEMQTLLEKLETDESVKVVVFESANPEFFIAPADFNDTAGFDEKLPLPMRESLHNLLRRMHRAQFLTIGVLRGHARGAGSEFLMGLDVRFASREKAVLSQIDPGTEFSNVTSGFERLRSRVGREQALEIILGSEDLDAETAERLCLIDCALPDKHLEEFVERFILAISSFDREYIALVKKGTNDSVNLTATTFRKVATIAATSGREF